MARRPLSALLSQVLVAYTIEFDGEFERRMGTSLSLVVWTNLMQFLGESAVFVRDLPQATQIKMQLGCLERWGFVVLDGGPRDGWGSGRGIRMDSEVSLTPKGLAAIRTWPPLFDLIERRWEKRFGKHEIDRLRSSLQAVSGETNTSLPGQLSRLLNAIRLEFDRESPLPLELCANTIRVLSENPTPAADIPRLTGCSRETSDIGWQLKPYVLIEPGNLVRLSPRGRMAQHTYHRLIAEIEKRWEIDQLRSLLENLFEQHTEDGPAISQGLIPPPGTVRAGEEAPALGRRVVAAAAKQRMRDMVAQTKAFIRDPSGTLPHYPLWDMNRGFGP